MNRLVIASLVVASVSAAAAGQVVFSDNYNSGASLLWGNERGSWGVIAGRYGAGAPTNNPPTFTSLPYSFADFELRTQVHAADDGGIWLRTDSLGLNGVLFVLARGHAYWHNMVNGGAGGSLNQASNVYTVGATVDVRIEVTGNVFRAYLNGAVTPTTTLTSGTGTPGRVALYDFRAPNHAYEFVEISGLCAGGCCPPLVSSQPVDGAVCPTGGVSLSVVAAGTGPFTYEWRRGGLPLTDGTTAWGSEVSGASGPTLQLSMLSDDDEGQYDCVIRNGCGTVTSSGSLLSIGATCDYNGDGGADTSDVIELADAIASGTDPNPGCKDFNGDGGADTSDVLDMADAIAAGNCP